MQTTAAIYASAGQPMLIDQVDLPDPGPTQVLVHQFATGVCHSQLHELNDPASKLPMLLGHESTGVVAAAGSAVSHVKEGDRVMITWIQRDPTPETPRPTPAEIHYRGEPVSFGAPAFTGVFTWAHDVVVDAQMVVKLDDDVPTDVTSIIGCAVMTGAGAALNAARVRPGDSVAIVGAGGVGLSIIQTCANLSAYPIVVVDVSPDKLAFACRFGATHQVNGSTQDPVRAVRQITHGGVDAAFDAIGIGPTIEQVIRMARDRRPGEREGGQAVVVGVPHGAPAQPNMLNVFSGKVYRGAPGGCCVPERDFPIFVRWAREGKFDLQALVTRRYRLEQINEACAALERGEIAGRAIVEF